MNYEFIELNKWPPIVRKTCFSPIIIHIYFLILYYRPLQMCSGHEIII